MLSKREKCIIFMQRIYCFSFKHKMQIHKIEKTFFDSSYKDLYFNVLFINNCTNVKIDLKSMFVILVFSEFISCLQSLIFCLFFSDNLSNVLLLRGQCKCKPHTAGLMPCRLVNSVHHIPTSLSCTSFFFSRTLSHCVQTVIPSFRSSINKTNTVFSRL